ncbi:phosphoribosylanthranilate isomerase [uncultured Parvibaculum sp.]|uniref:phosphoribosylanthranilate isomerase n=1 Tax=uncultured Parvibaculum sp. TaxID=291828 RepID=UPI0030D809A7
MTVRVKICGITDEAALKAAVSAGASYLGFVFFEKSPRHLTLEKAAMLAAQVPSEVVKVALTVNADDATLDPLVEALRPDILQLHGAEPPQRLTEMRERYGLTLMKAIPIGGPEDLDAVAVYQNAADLLLFDAKPPKSMAGALPGGNGLVFDWSLIAGNRPDTPWMLSGGLDADNVGEAIRMTGAQAVDVSSGVESAPGKKDPERIKAFCKAALGVAAG